MVAHDRSRLLIFDDGAGVWGPLTDMRSVHELRTGATKTRLRIERVVNRPLAAMWLSGWAGGSSPLEAVEVQRHPGSAAGSLPAGDESWLLVNSRWTATQHIEEVLRLHPGSALLQPNGQVVAAHVRTEMRDSLLAQIGSEGHRPDLQSMNIERLSQRAMIERPWHILEGLETALRADIAAIDLPHGDSNRFPNATFLGDQAVKIAFDANVSHMTVLDASAGPIAIDRMVSIAPFVVIEGPCYIGPGCNIAPHTFIRRNTSIGPCCAVGGEVSHSIMHGFSNKSHSGYLGHALVGKWVNLGADTVVSNLKNTYGKIRVQLQRDQPAEETGQSKLGPILGDFVRTAIGTRLLTGSCVGTGSMIALSAMAPKFVDRFTFLTDEGSVPTREEAFMRTAVEMMSRRQEVLSPAEVQRLKDLMQLRG
jgi:UDP-N-acetylglucosamine diphosphorylase / glucose-1-phosphate thymidylyltransferase / UDP-N-acetylgalactosamine diphosphorylase / glucosamine-1-phosphate N-acetyltransferase / galactosamine-1-phosphate N-acetyltransferase